MKTIPSVPVIVAAANRNGIVAAIAEMLLQDRPCALGVGPGNRERVRQERRQLRRRETTREQDNEPESENGPAEAQDKACPASHASTLATPGTLKTWKNDATSSTQPRRSSSSLPTSGRSFRSRADCDGASVRRWKSSAARTRRR